MRGRIEFRLGTAGSLARGNEARLARAFPAHFRASSPQISQKNAARPRHKTDGQVGQGCPRWVLGLLTNSWLPSYTELGIQILNGPCAAKNVFEGGK